MGEIASLSPQPEVDRVICDCGAAPTGDIADIAALGAVAGTGFGLAMRQRGDALTWTIGIFTIAGAAMGILVAVIKGVT